MRISSILCSFIATTAAVNIVIFSDDTCFNIAQYGDGDDAVCLDIDANTCCGRAGETLAGQSIGAQWGQTTPVAGSYQNAHSHQNNSPCAVQVFRCAMNDDAAEGTCCSGDLPDAVQGGSVTTPSSRRIKRAGQVCAEPNGIAFNVNGTYFAFSKDSDHAGAVKTLATLDEKHEYARTYGRYLGSFGRN